jgi:acyl-CoA synthetase (AMP-forming)/AMP-acid ligase II
VVADGVPGEITVRGDGNASGYFGNAEETARSFRDGRFFSGDIGYRDPDGYLFITDRSKDMIISAGSTSIRRRSSACCSVIRRCRTAPSSACPTRNGARR